MRLKKASLSPVIDANLRQPLPPDYKAIEVNLFLFYFAAEK